MSLIRLDILCITSPRMHPMAMMAIIISILRFMACRFYGTAGSTRRADGVI